MGVPSFYKWLVNKYPNTVVKAVEEDEGEGGVDSSSGNPNGLEYDNLYLDMNGIIHPCFHPEDHPSPPTTFEEVFNSIHDYIDRLFHIVRPRNLLYIAIDGVAPRAKMNQQRCRRFRSSKDGEIADAEERRLRTEFEMAGKPVLPKQESQVSDPNIITPGTEFMDKLSGELKLYINDRLETNAGWKKIKVILSDANVPGEGEHKIMSFIRHQRASLGYNPNTRHCIYGLDADLIMLALATHEFHFSILREDILSQQQQPESHLALETNHNKAEPRSLVCSTLVQEKNSTSMKQRYQFLHVWKLREYLELDLKIMDPPPHVKIDLERIIDDFIFMCFFAGNDFLPHMPTLEIHEGAIDLLMHVYRIEFKNLGGYLVDAQRAASEKGLVLKLKRVEKFILAVGTYEEKIFKKRSEIQERRLKRLLSQYSEAKEEEEEEVDRGPPVELQCCASTNATAPTFENIGTTTIGNSTSSRGRTANSADISEILKNSSEFKEKLRSCIRGRADLFKNGCFVDKVKLGTPGWRERYYKEKFSAETKEDIETTRKAVVGSYTEGLCWVILYYFSGVPSWKWFYPYHYGPFASDLRGLSQVKLNFQKGLPFKPFDQLMGVLPPRSSHALPRVYWPLMTSEQSDIIDFYPADFEVDEEGKRFTWQGICKLPFIDEERLLSQTKKVEVELKDLEAERNKPKVETLYVRGCNEHLGSQIFSLYGKQHDGRKADGVKESIDTNLSGGFIGFISPSNENLCKFHKGSRENSILCVQYELPDACQHIPRLLEGINIPEKTISEGDIVETQLWHEYYSIRPPSNRFQNQVSRKNATHGPDYSLTKSSSEGIYKAAGTLWWSGRGNSPNNSFNSESSRKVPVGHGAILSSYSNATHGPDSRLAQSSSEVIYKPARTGWSGRGNLPNNSFDSESSRKFPVGHGATSSSYSRGQIIGSSSRGHNAYPVTYQGTCNWNENRKSSSIGRSESKRMEDLRISDSRQGFNCFGRAQAGTTELRSYRNSSVASRSNMYEWRHHSYAEAVGAPLGDQGWRQSSNRNTSHNVWRHSNLSPPSAPSVQQAYGRGQFTTNAATPRGWKSRDTPETSSH